MSVIFILDFFFLALKTGFCNNIDIKNVWMTSGRTPFCNMEYVIWQINSINMYVEKKI